MQCFFEKIWTNNRVGVPPPVQNQLLQALKMVVNTVSVSPYNIQDVWLFGTRNKSVQLRELCILMEYFSLKLLYIH